MSFRLSEMVASLRSGICPACGRGKIVKQSVCRACYIALPSCVRARLYKGIGKGYEQAFGDAMASLKVEALQLPPGATTPAIVDNDVERDDGLTVVTFGKHEGRTLDAVLKLDPTYLPWLRNAEADVDVAEAAGRFCDEHDDEITAAVDEQARARRKY